MLGARSIGRRASKFLNGLKPTNRRLTGRIDSAPPPPRAPSLPPEIWLEIIQILAEEDLKSIASVSRDLRTLALPKFLHSQLFFPFTDTFRFRRRNPSVDLSSYEQRSIERIRFLSEGPGANAVRELLVSPYPPGYYRRHRGEHQPIHCVTERLFYALPRFGNLAKLVLILPPVDDPLTSALSSLGDLSFLELELPLAAKGTIPVPARRTFLFNRNTSILATSSKDTLVLAFLYPDNIRSIVAGPSGTQPIARALAESNERPESQRFAALESLDLALAFISSSHFSPALLSVPTLSTIRLRRTATDISFTNNFPPLPAEALPNLHTYHGPAGFAASFTHNRTGRPRPLHTLRLWSSHSVSAADSRSPVALPPLLHQISEGSVANITHLELGVVQVPALLLDTLSDAFPALNSLSINAHFDAFHAGSVERRRVHDHGEPVALPEGLPTRLKTLRLGAQLAGDINELCAAARSVLAGFPNEYDPTSWRVWIVDRPWHVLEWNRSEDLHLGRLSVSYQEHFFWGFERGARMAAQRVAEAMEQIMVMIG
ncbi:Ubiquitin family protein [Mycena kentingensis (nom. inval.)]|nr:Ubiquitin family protein [Mycena kentingensis (nom. inval.)]